MRVQYGKAVCLEVRNGWNVWITNLQNSIHCDSVVNVNGDFDFNSDMNTRIKNSMLEICIIVLNNVFALIITLNNIPEIT